MKCRLMDVFGCLGVSEDASVTPARHLHTVVNLIPKTAGLNPAGTRSPEQDRDHHSFFLALDPIG